MRNNRWLMGAALMAIGILCLLAPAALADQVQLKDGTKLDGTVQKVEQGKVTILVGTEIRTVDILQVTNIDFDAAGVMTGTGRLPAEHFVSTMEAQEMLGH